MKTHWSGKLKQLNACSEAIEWAKTQPSFRVAWQNCDRGDWMLWLTHKLLGNKNWPTHQQVVLAACDCAALALKFVPKGEERPRKCITITRKWANGKATIEEVKTTHAAATTYVAGAAGAAYAAAAATYAAAATTYVAGAAAATYAAAAATYAAAAATYAAYDRKKMLIRCARVIRKRLTVPDKL